MVTTFVVDDELITNLNKLRAYAENHKNWSWLDNGRLKLTSMSHFIRSGDVDAAFAMVVLTDCICRHLSVRLRTQLWGVHHDPVEIPFTLASLIGFTGFSKSPAGMVYKPANDWVCGLNPSDGAFIVQQKVRSIPDA